jgi:hypothetical protein
MELKIKILEYKISDAKILLFNFLMKEKMKFQLNPWNHRADISAQAYLKPSKKGKKNVTELYLQKTL